MFSGAKIDLGAPHRCTTVTVWAFDPKIIDEASIKKNNKPVTSTTRDSLHLLCKKNKPYSRYEMYVGVKMSCSPLNMVLNCGQLNSLSIVFRSDVIG